jgi:molecular chaperone GrpE
LDDLERALKSIGEAEENKAMREGVELVYQKFKKTLESKGLKVMESIGAPFDVELHEAITQIPAPSEELKGKVVDEIEKGYFLNDKVIRFAKVVIGA